MSQQLLTDRAGEFGHMPGDTSFQRWLLNRRQVTQTTVDVYEYSLRRIERHSGKHRDKISLEDFESYLRNGDSPQSKQLSFVAFRMRHRWGAHRGKWPLDHELLEIRLPKKRNAVRPALTDGQALLALGHAVTPVQVRVMYLGLYAGLRLGEIQRVDAASWHDGIIEVRAKGGNAHRLPAHHQLESHRDTILKDSPPRKQLQQACDKMRSVVGAPLTSHWLRRTFSQRLRRLGVQDSVLGALLGHSPTSVLERHYAPPTWQEMDDALKRLNYGSYGQQTLF